jgi:protein-arginine kinase activator protein McsA
MQILSTEAKKKKEIEDSDAYVCHECQVRPAEIFQINGDYCLDCWQAITHTNS